VKRYPLRVGTVLRLAQKHAPKALVDLGVELERLGFATWPVFPVVALSLAAPVFPIPPETLNRPLELVKRWLALSRCERFAYVTSPEVEGNYLGVYEVADTLAELVRMAVQTGEIRLVEGPAAARDELQLADLRIFRAASVVFRADGEKPAATESADHLGAKPGPPEGETNSVERERKTLVPLLRSDRKEGESRRATIDRLFEAGKIKKLPGSLIAQPYNLTTELARVWTKTDREDGLS
jgi:hypothetical protein